MSELLLVWRSLLAGISQVFRATTTTTAAKEKMNTPTPEPLESLLTFDNVRRVLQARGYVFFDNDKPNNLNIVGVRSDTNGTNQFDDYLVVAFRNADLEQSVKVYPVTTDPGKYWLENPRNPKGTAILVPGQYRSTWKIGKHQGKYEALVQRRLVKVYRDADRDDVIDYEHLQDSVDEGHFGINIHRSNPYGESYRVDRWSAGCQVFQSIRDYDEFMEICRESAEMYGNGFTYTLVTEIDLRRHLATESTI